MNYCEKIRQSMIDGDDDSVVKYIKKSLLSGYDPKYILKNILIDALSLIAKKETRINANQNPGIDTQNSEPNIARLSIQV